MSRMVFALAALVAFVAGRFTAPEAAPPKPVVTVKTEQQVETITMHCPSERVVEIEDEPYEDPDAIEAEDTEAIRVLELESKRIAALEAGLGVQGALRGRIKDAKTGEHLVGVTVVASKGNEAFTAITDENGSYEIGPIPDGTYTVTMYYVDIAVEHRDVTVAAHKVTPLYAKIETSIDSIQNVPTGRTFEGVLGSSASPDDGITITDDGAETVPLEGFSEPEPDSLGITFNGSEATEDAYYD